MKREPARCDAGRCSEFVSAASGKLEWSSPEGSRGNGGQSITWSATEAIANTALGYLISLAATAIILPLFGYAVTGADAAGISASFTAISLARSFALRRLFNRIR